MNALKAFVALVLCAAVQACAPTKVEREELDIEMGPVANDDAISVPESGFVDVAVLDNDSCLAQGPVTLSIESPPVNGSVRVNPDESIAYRARSGFTGVDGFQYRLVDSGGGAAEALVEVWVGDGASPPSGVGSIMLTWAAPTESIEGAPLGEISRYRLRYRRDGESQSDEGHTIDVGPACRHGYVVEDLKPGTYRFEVKAVDSGNVESGYTEIATETIE